MVIQNLKCIQSRKLIQYMHHGHTIHEVRTSIKLIQYRQCIQYIRHIQNKHHIQHIHIAHTTHKLTAYATQAACTTHTSPYILTTLTEHSFFNTIHNIQHIHTAHTTHIYHIHTTNTHSINNIYITYIKLIVVDCLIKFPILLLLKKILMSSKQHITLTADD